MEEYNFICDEKKMDIYYIFHPYENYFKFPKACLLPPLPETVSDLTTRSWCIDPKHVQKVF